VSTTLVEPATAPSLETPAQRLRCSTAATRVSLRWFGVRKTLSSEQKAEAAQAFGAEGEYLSARKKLLDTRHPAYKEVTAIRGRIGSYWKGITLPYPEPGIRLIQQAKVEEFNAKLVELRSELQEAVARLDDHYAELKAAARKRLGRLYASADYPACLEGLFELEWDFPSVEPAEYLLNISPAIYEQESQRVASRFEEAVQLAEQAFLSEFARLVAHLTERLNNDVGVEQKVFRNSAVTNLVEFFQRFRQLSIGSSDQLDELVAQAQRIVRGVGGSPGTHSGSTDHARFWAWPDCLQICGPEQS
jgi:hypothetical protein